MAHASLALLETAASCFELITSVVKAFNGVTFVKNGHAEGKVRSLEYECYILRFAIVYGTDAFGRVPGKSENHRGNLRALRKELQLC